MRIFIFIFIFISFGCKDEPLIIDCSDEFDYGQLSLDRSSREFYPYTVFKKAIFKDSTGHLLELEITNDTLLGEEKIFEDPCNLQESFFYTYKWRDYILRGDFLSQEDSIHFYYQLKPVINEFEPTTRADYSLNLVIKIKVDDLTWGKGFSDTFKSEIRPSFVGGFYESYEKYGRTFTDVAYNDWASFGQYDIEFYWNKEFGIVAFKDLNGSFWVLESLE